MRWQPLFNNRLFLLHLDGDTGCGRRYNQGFRVIIPFVNIALMVCNQPSTISHIMHKKQRKGDLKTWMDVMLVLDLVVLGSSG